MQKQYEAIVAQNKSLQSELRLANKTIELILVDTWGLCEETDIQYWKNEAIKELGE